MAFWIGLYPKPFLQILEQPATQIVQSVTNPQGASAGAMNAALLQQPETAQAEKGKN
jgi:hypothetical protein